LRRVASQRRKKFFHLGFAAFHFDRYAGGGIEDIPGQPQ
jgi:hypothetical protein